MSIESCDLVSVHISSYSHSLSTDCVNAVSSLTQPFLIISRPYLLPDILKFHETSSNSMKTYQMSSLRFIYLFIANLS